VDLFRNYPPAADWVASQTREEVALPGFVAMEILKGCHDYEEQRKAEAWLRPFRFYWPDEESCLRAYTVFATLHLSHGVGIFDALIAHTAIKYDAQLVTFNAKHYGAIPELSTVEPYKR